MSDMVKPAAETRSMGELETIKKNLLDIMRHNSYTRGRIEIHFDVFSGNCNFSISTYQKRIIDGKEKTITVTEQL